MSRILLLNPNKWGRGITTIWIASHSALLKKNGHQVELFDSTFYKDWSDHEFKFNTKNKQYKERANLNDNALVFKYIFEQKTKDVTAKNFKEALKKISTKEPKIICSMGSLYFIGSILKEN